MITALGNMIKTAAMSRHVDHAIRELRASGKGRVAGYLKDIANRGVNDARGERVAKILHAKPKYRVAIMDALRSHAAHGARQATATGWEAKAKAVNAHLHAREAADGARKAYEHAAGHGRGTGYYGDVKKPMKRLHKALLAGGTVVGVGGIGAAAYHGSKPEYERLGGKAKKKAA